MIMIQKYEFLWKIVYLTVTIFSAIMFDKMYRYQTLSQFDDVRKGTFLDLLIYGVPFSILFTICDLKIHDLFDKKCEDSFITLERYTSPSAKTKRSYTLVKWMYSLVYYCFSSVIAFLLIKDTSYFPTWLGGTGSLTNFISNSTNFQEATLAMKVFYICQFGKHLSRMFSHMFIRQEGNYYEYILHHALSTFLILYSYLMNMWLIGTMVLFLHDFSDFFLISARTYKDYRHNSKTFLQILYVLGFSFWVICRNILFNICCVIPGTYDVIIYEGWTQSQREILFPAILFMGCMLAALEVLHVFWTYYILSSFISVNVSEKVAKHTYD